MIDNDCFSDQIAPYGQLEACAHPFFDELREPNARLPNGRQLPPIFNFKQEVCLYFIYVFITDGKLYKPMHIAA